MEISMDAIKELREMTSCGVIECKKALEESKGDFGKAKEILLKRGLEIAAKKGSSAAKQGRMEAYIHAGSQIGVIVEVNCETDFVARNDDFRNFVRDVAMQIAATNPKYIRREQVSEEELKGHPNKDAYFKEVCLMEQPFIKEPQKTIQDCLNGLIASIGENILISRFSRYKVGENE